MGVLERIDYWFAVINNDAEARELLNDCGDEIERLRAALRKARDWARESQQVTTRNFATICGVTPTQLCEWTHDPFIGEPDFID